MGSVGDSSSEATATVKSERVAMLIDGDRVSGVAGIGSVSGVVTGPTGRG